MTSVIKKIVNVMKITNKLQDIQIIDNYRAINGFGDFVQGSVKCSNCKTHQYTPNVYWWIPCKKCDTQIRTCNIVNYVSRKATEKKITNEAFNDFANSFTDMQKEHGESRD